MAWLKEFKDFAVRGNAMDLAVGVVIGAAFGKIVSSLVSDIINPPLGLLLGRIDFSRLKIPLTHTGDVAIRYGSFLTSLLDFVVVAVAIFFVVKQINRLQAPPEPASKECPACCTAIPIKARRCPHCTTELGPTAT